MRTCPAVAVTVLAALAGAAGIVAGAASGIPAPTRPGVAQPQVRALAGLSALLAGMVLVIITIFRGGRLRSEVTRA
jgi:hypothetical protein